MLLINYFCVLFQILLFAYLHILFGFKNRHYSTQLTNLKLQFKLSNFLLYYFFAAILLILVLTLSVRTPTTAKTAISIKIMTLTLVQM